MAKVDPQLRKAWRENPDDRFDLIVHVEGDVQERSAALKARGASIKRTLRLTNTIAIRCDGKCATGLTRLSWVTRTEADGPVRASGR